MGVNGNTSNPSQYTPRGATPLLAAQIEREIDELKTLFKVAYFHLKSITYKEKILFRILNFLISYYSIIVIKSHRDGMMEALDKTPKPAAVIKTQDDDSFILNEDPLLMVSGVTCHSTPSKKQHERYGRSRNSSLPSTDKPKKRSSSYSHSYDRQNSLDSELDQGCSNQSILKEKRLEFERRREQVSFKCHSHLPTSIRLVTHVL